MRRLFLGVGLCFFVLAATAYSLFASNREYDSSAHKIPVELENVGIKEHFGEQVDLDLTFRNEKGETVALRSVVNGRQPVLLFLAYYGCPNLCNLFLNGATDGLKKLEWTAGKEFQIVTISIDPRETPDLAGRKKEAHLLAYQRAEAKAGWNFWVNDVPATNETENTHVKTLAKQVGFGYKYDANQDQYAHSAGMMILTPEGKISRYLFGIEYQPKDLKLALVEAGGGKIGTFVDHFLLFCYHYDPVGRKYSLYATNMMRAGGGVTVFVVGGVLTNVWRRSRRRKRKEDGLKNA